MVRATLRVDGCDTIVEASSLKACLREARTLVREGDYHFEPGDGTMWIDAYLLPHDEMDEPSWEQRTEFTVKIDPPEPRCTDERGHLWRAPRSIVGGLGTNPGVWANGGGEELRRALARLSAEAAAGEAEPSDETPRQLGLFV